MIYTRKFRWNFQHFVQFILSCCCVCNTHTHTFRTSFSVPFLASKYYLSNTQCVIIFFLFWLSKCHTSYRLNNISMFCKFVPFNNKNKKKIWWQHITQSKIVGYLMDLNEIKIWQMLPFKCDNRLVSVNWSRNVDKPFQWILLDLNHSIEVEYFGVKRQKIELIINMLSVRFHKNTECNIMWVFWRVIFLEICFVKRETIYRWTEVSYVIISSSSYTLE